MTRQLGARTRRMIYGKTGFRCYYCGIELVKENWSIDHIVPFSVVKSDDIDNMIGACISCNKRKKNLSMEDFRSLQSRKNQGIPYFSPEQKKWLETNGFTKHIPEHELFWWEKQ